MRSAALLLVVAALACKREGDRHASVPAQTGSAPGSIVVVADAAPTVPADAAPTAPPDAAPVTTPTKLTDAACKPRALGKDPGPTKRGNTDLPVGPPAERAEVIDACTKHADCKEYEHGRCVRQGERTVSTFGQQRFIPAHNECVYDECTSDAECRRTSTYEPRAELVCSCAPDRNTCSFANCREDRDCPSPFTCGGWHYCHSAADACGPRVACKPGEECVYSWDVKHYECRSATRVAPD